MLTLSADQKTIADAVCRSFQEFGWNLIQTCGGLSAAMGETSMGIDWHTGKVNIHVPGDHDKAHGLFQIWDVLGVKRGCGVDIKTASIEDQVRAVDWMLRHGDPADRAAGRMLLAAATPADAARAFIAFERPLDRQSAEAKRVPYAEDFYLIYAPPGAVHPPATPPRMVPVS